MSDLVRSNKVTAYWEGDGIAIGQFYRTHDKILTVKSNEEAVVNAGFAFPEGTDEVPVTAQQKLEAFKTFLMTNAAVFGISYDPVDRRAEDFKFPSKYDEENIKEYSKKMLSKVLTDASEKVQNNVIANMIKSGHVAEGTEIKYGIGDATVNVTELYKNGGIKYAEVVYPVAFAVGESQVVTEATVQLVSGQLKKPRELKDVALTMTSIKGYLVEAGLLPKIEKAKKEDVEETSEADAE